MMQWTYSAFTSCRNGVCTVPVQADREVVLVAVQSCGLALRHASITLQKDWDVARAAVKSHGLALEYLPDALRADKTLVLTAAIAERHVADTPPVHVADL
eukprot:3939386-Amphidinium_carterae.2